MTGPLGPHVVTRKPRMSGGGVDDPVEVAPAKAFPGCAVYPRGNGTEASGRELTVIQGKTALIPGATEDDIRADDVLEWRGRPYDVVGDPGEWFYLDGTYAGLQVNLEKARG